MDNQIAVKLAEVTAHLSGQRELMDTQFENISGTLTEIKNHLAVQNGRVRTSEIAIGRLKLSMAIIGSVSMLVGAAVIKLIFGM